MTIEVHTFRKYREHELWSNLSLNRNGKERCEITIISFSRSICRGGLAALIGVTGKPYPSCLSCHSHPIRPFRAPSPRGEGCDTRIPSSKKRRRSRHESPEPWTLNLNPWTLNQSKVKRGCEEMRIHFFTAPFHVPYSAAINIGYNGWSPSYISKVTSG